MAKKSGLAWSTLSVDDSGGTPRDIRNDITNLDISTPRAMQETTGIDVYGTERLHLLADCVITLNGVFNDAADKSHSVFKDFGSGARTLACAVSGQTLTPPTLLFDDYQLKRSDKGELLWSTKGMSADGTVAAWS